MSTEEVNYFEEGVKFADEYYNSQAYSGGSRYIPPDVAAKLYFPPEEEQLLQVSRPMSKKRQKWIAGFRKRQIEILAQQVVDKRKENTEKE